MWSPLSESGGTWKEGQEEKVPAAYNDKAQETTPIKQQVKGRAATIDFNLDSKIGPLPSRPKLKAQKK